MIAAFTSFNHVFALAALLHFHLASHLVDQLRVVFVVHSVFFARHAYMGW
jgi:hypothetical protein